MLRFVAAILAITILLLLLLPKPSPPTEESIIQLALEDARQKFPNADVGILKVEKRGEDYIITVRVTEGWDTKCPKRYHITYIYPERHFVGEKELMNPSCEPCNCPTPPCVILFEEEAVAATAPYGEGIAKKVEKRGNIWTVYWNSGPVSIYDNCTLVGDDAQAGGGG